ncbi:hypothetical protein EWB00_002727 [Schistosoma japonicum]|uniref:Ig-like domain-containing protein n=1 Tax=Schistosoma japonicum TaxID=6182 RepID=A0A4Z2DAV9_SCHJA|nr:hypothetical protein EWB00_002727 [Schistosoma japonicum]
MILPTLLFCIEFIFFVSSEFSTSLSILNVDSWTVTRSKIVYLGQPLKLRCSASSPDNITISRKDYDRNVTTQLVTKFGNEVYWEVSETGFSESGVYECISRGFSNIVTVYIYSIIGTNDVTVPTVEYLDKIGHFNFTRRQLDDSAFLDDERNWMSCTCVVGSVKLLDIVTVTWEGGLFDNLFVNHSQINQVYSRITTRDPSVRAIKTRLRLNLPLLDQRIFGQYRCVFSFSKSEHAIGTVHLKVPPILRLVHDPPPIPPTNSTGRYICTTSPCQTLSNEDNSNWTNACEIRVAYPPVKPKNLAWGWTQPQWAGYIIRRVQEVGKENVLSEFSMLLSDGEKDGFGPMQVLERKRRSTTINKETKKPDLDKSGPILFWCWAKNDIGQTITWWPGPVENYGDSIWSSVWWPVLGVSLELLSLIVVFAFFRYCRRQRNRYGLNNNNSTEAGGGNSFGHSRLLDTDIDSDQVEMMKITNHPTLITPSSTGVGSGLSHALHTHGAVPYIRLCNQNLDHVKEKHTNTTIISDNSNKDHSGTKITTNHSLTHGYLNPNLIQDMMDTEVEAMVVDMQNLPNEHDLTDDDYFWDSDTGNNNEDKRLKLKNNNHTFA